MKGEVLNPASVLRFSLAFLAVKFVALCGAAFYTRTTGDQPSIPPYLVTIVAVGVAMLWYSKAIHRTMTGLEIFTFSIGNVLADIALTVGWVGVWMWQLGIPFSWVGVGTALGGDVNSHAARVAFSIGFTFGELRVFLWSALFAWLISKRLPKAVSPAEKFE